MLKLIALILINVFEPAHAANDEIICEIKNKADQTISSSQIIRPKGGNPNLTDITILSESPRMYLFGIPANGDLTRSSILRWGKEEFFSTTGDISQNPITF